MTSFKEEKQELIKLYIQRNAEMNLDPAELIINNMNKLGYSSIHYSVELNNSLFNEYVSQLNKKTKEILNLSYNEWVEKYKETYDYLEIEKSLDDKISRSIKLSKYVSSNLIKDFYNSCTIEELNFLGY
uniref:Uncharacterized protein n=1 Tax=viral metagenome TaxID=1070528 RepID=A0A6C0DAL6_9ZZZZ